METPPALGIVYQCYGIYKKQEIVDTKYSLSRDRESNPQCVIAVERVITQTTTNVLTNGKKILKRSLYHLILTLIIWTTPKYIFVYKVNIHILV